MTLCGARLAQPPKEGDVPSVVIKPVRGRDGYVVWSTVTESPHGYGDRKKMAGLLRSGIRGETEDSHPVLARADRHGTSDFTGYGGWDHAGFIYKQAGWLPRRHLWRAAVWQCEGRVREILDLLDPCDDEDGAGHLVARKAATVNGPLTPGVRIAEAEIALAGAAIGVIRRTVEGWNRT